MMFDSRKKYWFELDGKFNVKGSVVEETSHLLKLIRDDGSETIIPTSRITNVNEAKFDVNKTEDD